MKELSINEKAKRYDNALKVLHKYDGANIMFSQSLKEEMFPELKESEDERIRNLLIKHLEQERGSLSNDEAIKAISWLEKQGKLVDEYEDRLDRCACESFNKGYKAAIEHQNKWKPSEEQMHYLSWIANIKLGDSVVEQEVSKHLNELLEDLKKLREK